MRKVFRELREFGEVLNLLISYSRPKTIEEVPIEGALGRVVAEDVVSDVDVPGFDRAAVDGYALRAEDTFWVDEDRPAKLRVIGKAAAGHPFLGIVDEGEAVEIATGAPIPKGANAVVMEEHT
ncbi:MAG: molybdopterin biosynthesis protein, partial [Candidatus Korarchaeota archaeon]|nr:molybdopterin biosynthesis protein [Candidatus Korarchaeota archaeon]